MAKRKRPTLTPEQIREIRLRLGLTQQEAADKVGVARKTWMYYENARRNQVPSAAVTRLIQLLAEGKL